MKSWGIAGGCVYFLLTLCKSWASDFLPFLLFSDSVRMKIFASCISRIELDLLELVNWSVVLKVGEYGSGETRSMGTPVSGVRLTFPSGLCELSHVLILSEN